MTHDSKCEFMLMPLSENRQGLCRCKERSLTEENAMLKETIARRESYAGALGTCHAIVDKLESELDQVKRRRDFWMKQAEDREQWLKDKEDALKRAHENISERNAREWELIEQLAIAKGEYK